MINSVQATPERGPLRPRQRRITAIALPMLLVLGGLLVWAPAQANAQVFAINPISNASVLVGTPITIQISLTNTTGATSCADLEPQ